MAVGFSKNCFHWVAITKDCCEIQKKMAVTWRDAAHDSIHAENDVKREANNSAT